MSRLDDFDPNVQPDPWATYCPGRYNGGLFKTHTQRGHAVSAMNNHGAGILYKHDNGQWVEVTRRDAEKAPPNCENCGVPGEAVDYLGRYYGKDNTPRLFGIFERDDRGKLAQPPRIIWTCHECRKVLTP